MKQPPDPPSFLDEAKALSCVHCGLCLASCPTYLETGNENDSPRGRIYLMRAVHEGRLPVAGAATRHLDLCLGCRACEAVCPSGVPYGELLEETRHFINRSHRRSLFQYLLRRGFIESVFPYPSRLRAALAPARFLKRLRAHHWLPRVARDLLHLVPDSKPHPPLPALSPAWPGQRRGQVGFIPGCVMSVLFAHTNAASVRLLNWAGFDVVVPQGQGCCGALHAHAGRMDQARAFARHNIQAFAPHALDAIIINAAGCGSTLKEYGPLLHKDPAWSERGARFGAQVQDLTEWLVTRLPSPTSSAPASSLARLRVTYHDACHLAHPQHITQPPRDLLRAVAREQFVELRESDVCCGSAGSYSLTEPGMARRLQSRKVRHILDSGAQIVVSTNPGCLLQIQAGLAQSGAAPLRVMHLADYLAQCLLPAQ